MGINLGISNLTDINPYNDILAGLHPTMEVTDIVIASGQNLKRGACLGKKTKGDFDTVAAGADAGNTGNGVLTLEATPTANGVKEGIYKVVFIGAGTDAGNFQVEDPDGIIIGSGNVGTLFNGVVKFTIADGTTDFVEGDIFNITVAFTPGSGKYYLWDTTASDGTEVLAGILGCDVDATEVDGKGFIYVHGEFMKDGLTAAQAINTGVYNDGAIVIKEVRA